MNAVNNMRLLGGSPESKKSSTGAFSLKFDIHKVNTHVDELLVLFDISKPILASLSAQLPEEACR